MPDAINSVLSHGMRGSDAIGHVEASAPGGATHHDGVWLGGRSAREKLFDDDQHHDRPGRRPRLILGALGRHGADPVETNRVARPQPIVTAPQDKAAPQPAGHFARTLDEIIARDAARNWSYADAVAALRRCGTCDGHDHSFPGRCETHSLWRRAGDPACTDHTPEPPDTLDDYRDDLPAIGHGDVGSAGR